MATPNTTSYNLRQTPTRARARRLQQQRVVMTTPTHHSQTHTHVKMDIEDAVMKATTLATSPASTVNANDEPVEMMTDQEMTDQSTENATYDIHPHSSSHLTQMHDVNMIPINNHHNTIHRLDQTTLRLCAHLLHGNEIICFGCTCHTLYATLNHPLSWQQLIGCIIYRSEAASELVH